MLKSGVTDWHFKENPNYCKYAKEIPVIRCIMYFLKSEFVSIRHWVHFHFRDVFSADQPPPPLQVQGVGVVVVGR